MNLVDDKVNLLTTLILILKISLPQAGLLTGQEWYSRKESCACQQSHQDAPLPVCLFCLKTVGNCKVSW